MSNRGNLMNIRSGESGIAMIVALFMVLVLSVLAASLVFVARTETFSSLNYRTMAEARYGAESGVHSAVNHLIWTYSPPEAASATDPISNYNINVSPVTLTANGRPAVLSSDSGWGSNYPADAVRVAFVNAANGQLHSEGASSIMYTSRATLLSMKTMIDSASGLPATLQTWSVTGRGLVEGAGSAAVEVSAVLERPMVPLYRYAAFSVDPNCQSMNLAGGATVDSYDSTNSLVGGLPTLSQYGGNIGTNGGVSGAGDPTTVYGTLSSPRTGVGACSAGNVTAFTSTNGASIEGGLVHLPQALTFPTPPDIVPPPPTTTFNAGSAPSCASASYCSVSSDTTTFSPPGSTSKVQLGNVSVQNGKTLVLNAGIYEINSLDVKGDLLVASGPVIIRVAGQGFGLGDVVVDVTANAPVNPSYAAAHLQFIYGGESDVKLRGNGTISAVVYAPNAVGDLAGLGAGDNGLYGSLLTKTVKATGGAGIHYDRNLDKSGYTIGNPMMSAFTWKSY